MYALITVISDLKKLKKTLKILGDYGVTNSIVIDSMGTNGFDKNYTDYRPAFEASLIAFSEVTHYRKTIISTVDCRDKANQAMDAVQEYFGGNLKKPQTAIMFTIPMLTMFDGDVDQIFKVIQ